MRNIVFIWIIVVLCTNRVCGDTYTLDSSISCDVIPKNIYALYGLNQYTCSSGYYLPANNLGCQSCPTGLMCDGGTFNFSHNKIQGIYLNNIPNVTINKVCADNFPNRFDAIYVPNQHTCISGYYMPANYDGCVICLADSYCPGGTYAFNKTITQGIVSCVSGLYAPMGMWELAQCGRILHIGDEVVYLRSTKKTTPALHIDIDNDGVADFFGNVTTADVPMTRGTDRKLKLQYDGITYSVYDDSVDLSLYQE